jgi:hypothetical protein
MFQQMVTRVVTVTYGGANPAVNDREQAGLVLPTFCLGGATSRPAWSESDFPRVYAARIRRRGTVMPIGNNSEPVKFPTLMGTNKCLWIARLTGPQPPDIVWYQQNRQRPNPLWFALTGITKDSGGSPLGSCVVKVYLTATDVELLSTTSDASGNYSFFLPAATVGTYYVVAYKVGSPDVSGTTVNTLVFA